MRFSIIIPLYNKQNYIKKTIDSVFAQTYQEFEVIVVNDGSTDNSLKEALSITDPRVRVIDKSNGGVSSARNRGIQEAKNDWIVFLDADDVLYPNALATYMELHDIYPKIKVLCASIDSSNAKYPETSKCYLVKDFVKANLYSEMRTGISLCCTGSICIHKDCFAKVGYFSEAYTHGEDLDMWLRLNEEYIFAKSEKVVFFYDLNAENNSRKEQRKDNRQAPLSKLRPQFPPAILESPFRKILFGNEMYYRRPSIFPEYSSYLRVLAYYYEFIFLSTKVMFRIGIIRKKGKYERQ